MASERYISTNADLKMSRSRFPLSKTCKMGYFHGYLQPISGGLEVLPSDTWKVNVSAFTRMSTPIVPFLDNIRQEVDVFFVPKRILWNKTKQFYGEAEDFGIATKVDEPFVDDNSDVYLPTFDEIKDAANSGANPWSNLDKCESIACAFGLVTNGQTGHNVNILPIRAYFAVYNEYFRDENYQPQFVWDKDESGSVGVLAFIGDNQVGFYNSPNGESDVWRLPQVNKDRDVITSLLPWAQKGDPVPLSLASEALVPVITGDVNTSLINQGSPDTNTFLKLGSGVKPLKVAADAANGSFGEGEFNSLGMYTDGASSPSRGNMRVAVESGFPSEYFYNSAPVNLWADISKATTVKINDLLYALAYNDFLARAAHLGTRYREYIYAMFGCKTPDLSADVPEYLGRMRFNINVQQVVQTTGFTASSSSSLGALGAYSNSGKSQDLFTKSFTEPGYLVFVTYTKHQRTYSTGIDEIFNKIHLLDYYQTPFANIPDMPIDQAIYWISGVSLLGAFQEPWYDYKACMDRTYGIMNPMIDSLGAIWTLAERWSSKPTINGEFMKEDRTALIDALVTGENGPDYLMDIRIDAEVTRVMPLYSSGTLTRF